MSKYGWVAAIRGISTIVATVVGAALGAVVGAVASITVSLVWGRFTETGPEFRWDVLLLPAMLIVPVATVAGAIVAVRLVRSWTRQHSG